jgi:hypothetical protein
MGVKPGQGVLKLRPAGGAVAQAVQENEGTAFSTRSHGGSDGRYEQAKNKDKMCYSRPRSLTKRG